ncbi:hypothetical protein GPECTOR_113g292 [Gonium pectorale]|uniref:Uncharacterized protein n=1 Tax=Gonium pectorale TaxID=33097 RepID=A0A150G0N6_GONPE|nr:hypothetical protein GPECTOR_113g292 [Gonium pectorale]|eukprot:KXZ42880.1 hypothetical protein GPECTOR_113g292 [Gonium pectorale]
MLSFKLAPAGTNRTVRRVLSWSGVALGACTLLMRLMHDSDGFREVNAELDRSSRGAAEDLDSVLVEVGEEGYGAAPLLLTAVLLEGGLPATLAALLQALQLVRHAARFPDVAQLLATPTRHQHRSVSVLGCLQSLSASARVLLDFSGGLSPAPSPSSARGEAQSDLRAKQLKMARKVRETCLELESAARAASDSQMAAASAAVVPPPELSQLDRILLRSSIASQCQSAPAPHPSSYSQGSAPAAPASGSYGGTSYGAYATYGGGYGGSAVGSGSRYDSGGMDAMYGISGGGAVDAAAASVEALRLQREVARLQQAAAAARAAAVGAGGLASGGFSREGRSHSSQPPPGLSVPPDPFTTSALEYPWQTQPDTRGQSSLGYGSGSGPQGPGMGGNLLGQYSYGAAAYATAPARAYSRSASTSHAASPAPGQAQARSTTPLRSSSGAGADWTAAEQRRAAAAAGQSSDGGGLLDQRQRNLSAAGVPSAAGAQPRQAVAVSGGQYLGGYSSAAAAGRGGGGVGAYSAGGAPAAAAGGAATWDRSSGAFTPEQPRSSSHARMAAAANESGSTASPYGGGAGSGSGRSSMLGGVGTWAAAGGASYAGTPVPAPAPGAARQQAWTAAPSSYTAAGDGGGSYYGAASAGGDVAGAPPAAAPPSTAAGGWAGSGGGGGGPSSSRVRLLAAESVLAGRGGSSAGAGGREPSSAPQPQPAASISRPASTPRGTSRGTSTRRAPGAASGSNSSSTDGSDAAKWRGPSSRPAGAAPTASAASPRETRGRSASALRSPAPSPRGEPPPQSTAALLDSYLELYARPAGGETDPRVAGPLDADPWVVAASGNRTAADADTSPYWSASDGAVDLYPSRVGASSSVRSTSAGGASLPVRAHADQAPARQRPAAATREADGRLLSHSTGGVAGGVGGSGGRGGGDGLLYGPYGSSGGGGRLSPAPERPSAPYSLPGDSLPGSARREAVRPEPAPGAASAASGSRSAARPSSSSSSATRLRQRSEPDAAGARAAVPRGPDTDSPSDLSSLERLLNSGSASAEVIRFARSLTVAELMAGEEFYAPYIPGCGGDYSGLSLRQVCVRHVLPMGVEVEQLQINALCSALGAPVAVLDVAGSQVGAIKHGPPGARGPPAAWVAHLPGHYDVIYPARPLDVAPGGALIPV